ncbi:MAG: glycosyltransferase [Planctomycetaceae bacterium]|nr:glycosyltransferase [Planctomycetaceae bacterium]
MAKPIRVTIFNLNLAGGGGERFVQWLLTKVDRCRVRPNLLLNEDVIEYALPGDIEVVCMKHHGRFPQYSFAKSLADQLTLLETDVVITPLMYSGLFVGMAASQNRHTPAWIARFGEPTPPHSWTQWLGFQRFRRYAKNARALVQNSEGAGELLKKQMLNLADRVQTIRNTYSSEFDPASSTASRRRAKFLWVGRLEPVKCPELLLEAMELMPDKPDVEIVGDGSLHQMLCHSIRDKNLESYVTMTGRTSDVASKMKSADALVLTSHSEGMPNAIIEAMACGLPVISTDCPFGPGELVTSKTGRLVPVDDARSLANAMTELAASHEVRSRLGGNGRNRITEICDPADILEQWTALIEAAATTGGNSR